MFNTCVICNSAQNLNTSLNVILPTGQAVSVLVCDEHAEDITPKIAREKYIAKLNNVEEIIKMAQAAGLVISMPTSGSKLTIATNPEPEMAYQPKHLGITEEAPIVAPKAARTVPARPQPKIIIDNPDVITNLSALDRPMMGVSGTANSEVLGSQSIKGMPSYNIKLQNASENEQKSVRQIEEARMHGTAKLDIVEGRGGQPVAIPTSRSDGLGTTKISVSKAMDDAKLQSYFKGIADASRSDSAMAPDFRNGYDNDRPCPLCRGLGQIKQKEMGKIINIECPKCEGSGLLLITR